MANPRPTHLQSPDVKQKRSETHRKRSAQAALTEKERHFVEVYLQTGNATKAGEAIGLKLPKTSAHSVLNRPRVAKVIEQARKKATEKFIDKAANKLSRMMDLSDDRLVELLSAKRGIMPEVEDPDKELPIEDTALLRAIDLAHKRTGAIPSEKSNQQNTINGNVTVYQSAWLKPASPELPPAEEESK